MKIVSIADYREAALRRLPHFLFEYIDSGSYTEASLARNTSDLADLALRQRVMTDVSELRLAIELFGQRLAMPVILAPVGLAGLYARRGEVQAARAAGRVGVPFCLSTMSACSIEEVARGTNTPFWFQLYMLRDRGFMADVLARARDHHCPVLVFTVDLPVPGARYRSERAGLTGAPGLAGEIWRAKQALARPRWLWDVAIRGRPFQLGNIAPIMKRTSNTTDFFAWTRRNYDPRVTWSDLEWVRARWPGPIIVKGILDVADARLAVDAGADGIVVSNHGGRQLDGVPSTIRALPPIVDAVGDRTVVLSDGGVRSGLDVLRMLALGARGVLLGRAWTYALAARGEAGVSHMLSLIDSELRVAMMLTGCVDVAKAGPELVVRN